ncbi:MAG: hypothetical protein IT462_15760 [Planctomycetes bacterium]|nr:hypothetical protein [Planctomycetota bacterium]
MIGNPALRGNDATERPTEADVPEAIGFEEAEMTPEMSPMDMGPAAPVPQAGDSVPAELAPPSEMTPGDSFFDLRATPGAEAAMQASSESTAALEATEVDAPLPAPAVSAGLPPVNSEMDSDALMAHNAALTEEIHALREQLQQAAQAPAEFANLQQQLLQAQQQAANYRNEAQRLQEQLAGAASGEDFAKLAAQAQSDSIARKEAEEDLRMAREEVEHARAEQSALMSEIEALRAAPTPKADTAELEKALQEAARLSSAVDEANNAMAGLQRANEELMRQMTAQNNQMHETERARAEIVAQLQAREAEITSLQAEMAQAAPAPKPGKGGAELEAQLKTLKKELAQKEKEVKETREALDSESARSFRLSQRRIPALQNELAEAHAQGMEIRRKMEKLEAEKRVLAEDSDAAKRQMEELERALAAAKMRAQDTTIVAAPQAQVNVADEEIKRLGARLKAAEEERRKLSESLQQIDKGKRGELEKYEERLTRLQVESNERHENYLNLRKQLKLLAGRLSQTVKLAAMLAAATSEAQRKMLIDGIERLGKESEAVGAGQSIELATLAPPPSAPSAADSTPQPAVPASQAPVTTEQDKKDSSRTEIIRAADVAAPSPPAPSAGSGQAQSLGAPEDLVEPSAEPMSLDGLEPGLDGIPDDIGGPATDL